MERFIHVRISAYTGDFLRRTERGQAGPIRKLLAARRSQRRTRNAAWELVSPGIRLPFRKRRPLST